MSGAAYLRRLPQPFQQTLAALLGVLAVAVVLALPAYLVNWAIGEQGRWRESAAQSIATSRGWVHLEADIEGAAKTVATSKAAAALYPVADAAELAASVRRDVITLLSETGAGVDKAERIGGDAGDALQSEGVRIHSMMTMDQMQAILSSSRAHRPYLRVIDMQVSSPQSQTADSNPMLAVTLGIVGYATLSDTSPGRRNK